MAALRCVLLLLLLLLLLLGDAASAKSWVLVAEGTERQFGINTLDDFLQVSQLSDYGYAPRLEAEGMVVDDITEVAEADLVAIGMTKRMHRSRFMRYAKRLVASGGKQNAGQRISKPSATDHDQARRIEPEHLRGAAQSPDTARPSRWGVDDPPPRKGKLQRPEDPLPELGAMQRVPLMAGRRHFYGRGCAVVDINGDGHEDVFLANGDNKDAQTLFGSQECASAFFLSHESTGEFTDVPMHVNREQTTTRTQANASVPSGIDPAATEGEIASIPAYRCRASTINLH